MSEKFCDKCHAVSCHARGFDHWGRLMVAKREKVSIGPVEGYIVPGSIADCPRNTGHSSESGLYLERLNVEAEEYLKSHSDGLPSDYGLTSFIEDILED